jgi:lysophospholipase L1-like esterase
MTLIFLVVISLHYKIPEKILNKIIISTSGKNEIPVPEEYSGYIYAKETIESLIYKRSGFDIVMLGDSLTCHNNWGELLDRDDIVNFGIGGDTTDKIIKRIKDVYLVSPSKCFLMVGINDIFSRKSLEDIVRNYKIILEYLKENDIDIIIQSVLTISELSENSLGYNWKEINKKVIGLNSILKKIAISEHLQYFDINKMLSNGNKLDDIYTSGDGVHLNKKGYEIWGIELKKYL